MNTRSRTLRTVTLLAAPWRSVRSPSGRRALHCWNRAPAGSAPRSPEIETLSVNPSLAMRVNDRLSIGAGISYQRLQAELSNAVNYSAVVAQGVQQLVARGQLPAAAAPGIIAANAGLQAATRVRGHDSAWGFNVGVMFDASDTTRIGLSYRSTIDYNVTGSITFTPPNSIEPCGCEDRSRSLSHGSTAVVRPCFRRLESPGLGAAVGAAAGGREDHVAGRHRLDRLEHSAGAARRA